VAWVSLSIAIPVGIAVVYWDSLLLSQIQLTERGGMVLQLGWPGMVLHAVLLAVAVAALMNLESTFRASVGMMRWRIKYMLLGVGMILVARVYTSSQAVLFRGFDLSLDSLNPAANLLGCLLILRTFSRAGHFDLQVFPSQAVLRGSITVLVAGFYLVIVGVLGKIVTYLGGDGTFAFKTLLILVSLVFLALFLQSDRVRLTMGHFVSRHFNRPLYDYRVVWKKFTDGTATRMDRPNLCRALARLVADLFQALSVTIWIVDETADTITFGASTNRTETAVAGGAMERETMEAVIRYFHAHPEPVEFESESDVWAASLREWHPAEFMQGGRRVAVPIMSRGEVIGLITVGDRVGGGVAFGLQDFDMFKCIAEHASANLLNADLSQKLLQAKELESFQKMAAFFVHDLKNTASTLNLMLKNLPVHFNDPEFREDALRGIAKTVARINDLTGRLNTLRHEMTINLTEADINELITHAASAVQFGPAIEVVKNLTPLPKFKLDREQIGKVLLNLFLNAVEAMAQGGQIRIASGMTDNWVVVTVADTGCGMSAEFVSRSLFRPFQTTKKTGLGIGMFQCKAIVDAHGGKITVASEPAHGTVFQLFLPSVA